MKLHSKVQSFNTGLNLTKPLKLFLNSALFLAVPQVKPIDVK